jgi:hypothetical protein
MNKDIEDIKKVFLNRHKRKYKTNAIHKIINNAIEIPDENLIKEMCCEAYDCDLLSISFDKHLNPTFQYIINNNICDKIYELKITKSNNQWAVKICKKC